MSELTYSKSGDYFIPNLTLSQQSEKPLGKYGRMRKEYLQEHRPVLWNSLILSEKLYPQSNIYHHHTCTIHHPLPTCF